ncbi:MAG: hypothetical protein ACFFBP_16485 [Promethearchaeota archaeon]
MIDEFVLTEWELNCIKNLLNLKYAKLELIIVNDDYIKETSRIKIIKKSKHYLLFELYQKLIMSKSTVFRRYNCKKLFEKVEILRCKTTRKGLYSLYFQKDDIHKIKSHNLDFILLFGFGIIRGDILNTSRFGIWSYHHGDEKKYRGGPPLFWEIFYNDPISGTILQRLTDRLDAGIVLKKGYYKTINYSLSKNRERIYAECPHWPALLCIDIKNGNADYLNGEPSETKAPIYRRPKNGKMVLFLFKIFLHYIKYIFNKLFKHEIWNIGIVENPIQSFLRKDFKPIIKWLPKPKKTEFYADPFGLIFKDRNYIIFERFFYKNIHGEISYFEITKKGFIGPKNIISKPFHLSYPCVFEYENDIYCIPETVEISKVILYKSINFPNDWEKVKVLIDNVKVVDSTFFKYNEKFWLACSEFENVFNTNLILYYSDNLFGPWSAHPLNPVKIDIRSSRPAGNLFLYNGRLIRPAQDCSQEYGQRIILNEILKLTTTEFKERMIKSVKLEEREKFNKGIHTISSFNNSTLIDGKRFKFKKYVFKKNLAEFNLITKIWFISLLKRIFKRK